MKIYTPEQVEIFKIAMHNGVIGEWFLRPSQQKLYELIRDNNRAVSLIHRRYGKTTVFFVYFNEIALTEKVVLRAGGVTKGSIKQIYDNVQEHIFEYCPELKPKYSHTEDCYIYERTGSRIYLFGMSDSSEAEKARGTECDFILADEYGFWKFEPRYTLNSVLSPLLQHSKHGKIVITSTMPKDLTHDFLLQCAEARIGKYYFHWDINQSVECGEVCELDHARIIQNCGGIDSEDYKREYLLQEIASSRSLVIPEAQDETKFVVKDYIRPDYLNWYVAIDLGLKDMSAALFGYHDFRNSVLIIEDEYVCTYMTTEDKVKEWKAKEKEIGCENPRRFSDNDAQQIYDMNISHKYPINPVIKRSKQSGIAFTESVINGLRIAIKEGRVKVHPRCVNLVTQLKYGMWNDQRTDFERSTAMGHLDALVACAYLVDNIQWSKNPYPDLPKEVKESTHYIDSRVVNKNKNALKLIAGGRK